MNSSFRRTVVLILNGALIIAALFIGLFLYTENAREFLTVAFLDVGQGDAIFIEAPNGNQILIDGGPTASVVREISKIVPFYDRKIDMLIATHHDSDHTAGFPEVFKRYKIGNYATSHNHDDDALFFEIEKLAENSKSNRIILKAGDRIILDEAAEIFIDILWPLAEETFSNNNESSVVTRIVYNDVAFMLTGDVGQEVELKIVAALGDEIKSQILKAGHHGSKTSTAAEFVGATAPEYGIISAGLNNKFGHPHPDVVATLTDANVKILETAHEGAIIFKTDGKNFWRK